MTILLYAILLIWATWIFFQAVMNLRRIRDTVGLSPTEKVLGYPTLAIGYLLDFATQVTVATLIFLDLPKWHGLKTKTLWGRPITYPSFETTVTERLQRYANGKEGIRKTMALWVGTEMLNSGDPSGNHLD